MFRKWRNGDIIAILPTLPGTSSPYTCEMYEHVGQHGAGDPQSVIRKTKNATRSEYAALLKELHKIGYRNLVVHTRYQSGWLSTRRKELARMRG